MEQSWLFKQGFSIVWIEKETKRDIEIESKYVIEGICIGYIGVGGGLGFGRDNRSSCLLYGGSLVLKVSPLVQQFSIRHCICHLGHKGSKK